MPVVQRYERRIGADPVPGVRNTAAETPTSMGAGLAEAQGQQADTIGRLAGTVAHLAGQQIEEERLKNDELASLAAQNALAKASADITTRALAVKGKDALALPDTTTEEFTTAADAIAGGLANDRQRLAFAKVRSQHDVNLYATVGRHISQEMQSYRASELQSTVDLGISAVAANALDPRRGREELEGVIAAVKQQGPALGWGDQELADHVAKIQSAAHVAVVERLIDNQQPTNARIYYEETHAEIDGTKRGDLEKLLAHATLRADGQKEADAIIAAGGTLAEQRAKVKDIKDPDTRAAAMTLVEHEDAVNDRAKREADETLLDSVFARLKRNGGDMRSISAAEELRLGSHLPGLKNFSDDLARGVPRKSDKTIYYTMLDQAEREPANFATLNLRPLMLKLSDEDFDHLDRAQRAMRAGDKKAADVELDDYRSEQNVIHGALQLAGIDPTPKSDDKVGLERVARFQTLVANEARRVQADTKKKIGNADLESIANRILSRQIVDEGWFYNSTKSLGTATPADIPPADLTQIMDSLRRAGQPTTSENALAIWLRAQARKGAQ
jgi:hypothetical protein